MNARARVIFAWTLLAAGVLLHQTWLWTHGIPIETDLLALLPKDERDAAADQVLEHLSEEAQRTVVVLISAPTKAEALTAATAFRGALTSERLIGVDTVTAELSALPEVLERYKETLLTPQQEAVLTGQPPAALAERALRMLQRPMGARVGSFREDPLQLYPEYLQALAERTALRPEGDVLMLEADHAHHVLLRYLLKGGGAFSLEGVPHLRDALEQARAALPDGATMTAAGVPLFAEAAAVQANAEVTTVGFGSLAAILVVMFLAFRSLKPLLLVVLSVGLGVMTGLTACVLLFGKVHVMTLVIGASLVGVAEDYGIHYFASRQARPQIDRRALLDSLTPGLVLALVTSIAGYVMLALAPFPGLRQVAVFSSIGLTAAFLTVWCWFPTIDRGTVRPTAFSQRWAATLNAWPSLTGRRLVLFVVSCVGLSAAGALRLSVQDDVRALQASPSALIDAQRLIAERIGLPSPAQFFVVRGATEAQRLEREEALVTKLRLLQGEGAIGGFDAVTSWVSSPSEQARRRALFTQARAAVLTELADELEDATPLAADDVVLTVADAMKTPLSAVLQPLWLKDVSVVMLHAPKREALGALAALSALEGVRFVDRTGDISRIMERWRVGMSVLLAVGYAVVFAALFIRFRGRAWQALLPTALSSGLTLSLLAFLGEPITLFHVLGLFLLLGMGVDYGVFLVEHREDANEAWLAVGLGAVSTFLSFGLLAISSTPAIHAFGMTLGVGIALVWVLAPFPVWRRASSA